MNKEQTRLFIKLTKLQQYMAIAKVHNEDLKVAYKKGGGQATTATSISTAINQIMRRNDVNEFIISMMDAAVKKALCTTEDIVKALMKESLITPSDLDTTSSSRVSALKTLTDYAGGFDKNVQKVKQETKDVKSFGDMYED